MIESDVPFQSADVHSQDQPLNINSCNHLQRSASDTSHSSTSEVAQLYELVDMEGHRM